MKKGIIEIILSLIVFVGDFIILPLTSKNNFWNIAFFILLIIVFPTLFFIGFINIVVDYNNNYRYGRLLKKYQKKYDSNKSLIINVSELIYYLNIKYLGGDILVFKYEDEFHIIERQILIVPNSKQKFSMYKLDNMMCGNDFNKVLTKPLADGKTLNELNDIELAFVNNKFPKVLKEKRIYDNVKPHSILMISSIVLIIFGIMFLFISTSTSDWYNALIFGGIFLLVGIILLIILIKDINDESKIK